MSETFICTCCREEHPLSDCVQFNNKQLCHTCLDTETCLCVRCGARIWREDDCGDEDHTLCHDCEEQYYDHCADCGALVERDDLYYLSENSYDGYCAECYSRHARGQCVQSYCYRPEPIFYGDGLRYLGVELEIDDAGERNDYASQLLAVANEDCEHVYIKHDGSLDDGLEIVTHPMTLDYHRHEMPWIAILNKALRLGYISHQAGTCGLHVHVNRYSLGCSREEQEETIARILFLVENFWHELLRFSRRTQQQMDRWATRYGRKDDPQDVLYSAKRKSDRYTCVNLTPHYTIEFRMFRGTLKYNTLIATLQMVELLCDVALSFSDDQVKTLTWSEMVSNLQPEVTPELIQYLKERRLYVNDPVTTTEEV